MEAPTRPRDSTINTESGKQHSSELYFIPKVQHWTMKAQGRLIAIATLHSSRDASAPPGFLSALQFPISPTIQDTCASLTSITSISNTTITSAVRYPAGSNITTCCTPCRQNAVDICRVSGDITTSSTSSMNSETWHGRTKRGKGALHVANLKDRLDWERVGLSASLQRVGLWQWS